MKKVRARAIKDMEEITPVVIRKVVLSLFCRRHDYGDFDLSEVVTELGQRGISTVKQLRLLLKKHRRSILNDERSRMARAETAYLISQFGSRGIDAHTNTAWFAIPGLVREALEKEFGWEVVAPFNESVPDEVCGREEAR